MNDEQRREVPAALAARISADLAPVRPLPRAEMRFGVVALLATLAAALMLFALGMRRDMPFTSPVFLIMLAIRIEAGALLAILALRESIPGRHARLDTKATTVLFALAVLFLFPRFLTGPPSPAGPGFCFPVIVLVALPSFAALLWLLARAYPLHPVRTGAIAGLGSGLLAEAAQFIACSNSGYMHASVIHGGAAVSMAICGLLGGWLLEIRRRRQFSLE
ncbi:MAG TPA: NrsF family protein [Thermoanaerobaculia bacterium]|jgi:hypothetical protein